MRRIERTVRFAATSSARNADSTGAILDFLVSNIVSLLAEDKPLSEKNRDHGLSGDWRDHRECHLRPDLLLVTASRMFRFCNLFAWVRTANSLVKSQQANTPCFRVLN
jgi:mRNA interferase YafQ